MPGLVTPELASGQPEIPGVRRCQGGLSRSCGQHQPLRGGGRGGGRAIIAGQTIGMLRLITIITLRATVITTLPLPLLPQTHFTLMASPPILTVRHELLRASEVLCWRFLLPTIIIILLSKYLPIIAQIFHNKLYSFTIPAAR